MHPIAVALVPIALQHGVGSHEWHEFLLRHGGIKGPRLLEVELLARLLEEVTHNVLLHTIAHALAPDDAFVPMTGYELVKAVETHRLAAVVHESRDTILITMVVAMAMRVVAFVVMVMAVAMWVIAFVVMVLMIVVMIMIMLVMVVLVVVMMMLLLHVALYLLNPCSRGSYLFEIKELGVENLTKRHIAVVTFDDLCFGLNCANNGNYLLSLFFVNF